MASAPAAGSPGVRASKKRETRRRILEAAFELFQRRGYAGTSLAEIAVRAAVAPRTVSNYFPAKVDLLVAYREDMLELFERSLSQRGELPPLERVGAALGAVARENERHPSGRIVQQLLARHASYHALRRMQDRFQADIESTISSGALTPGTDPTLAALALTAAHLAVLQRWSQAEGGSLARQVEALFGQWRRGVESEG
jgi:AcrR family transcriptional regulator